MGSKSDGSEGGFYGVGRGKQDFFIFLQAFAGLWEFGLVTGNKLIVSCQNRFAQ
jgi:hypothetical protein